MSPFIRASAASTPAPGPFPPLSPRAFSELSSADSWEEIWEAGAYYRRIAERLESARRHAVFVGWQVDSRLPLHRPENHRIRETLRQKVIRICDAQPELHVYFLMWDHAYFYCLERELFQGRVWEDVHPRVHFIFDNRHPAGSSHHEKLALIDGEIAFCGGIDLCDERWDSPRHLFFDPRRSLNRRAEHHGPYHDLAVQVTGPVCASLHRHVERRWKLLSNVPFPPAAPPSGPPAAAAGSPPPGLAVYVSRTIAEVDRAGPGPLLVREVEFLFRDLIRAARRRIILEGQYFWSHAIARMLITKMEAMRGSPFELILILADLSQVRSMTRQMAPHELSLLITLEAAARRTGTRLTLGTPVARVPSGRAHRPVYVHSKLVLVDDRFLSIGSANFAARALRLDTEVNLTFEARTERERLHIRTVARRVLEHWGISRPRPARGGRVTLRRCRPAADLRKLRRAHPWLSRVPWQRFFDPVIPWHYFLKLRHPFPGRNATAAAALVIAALASAGAAATVGLSGAPPGRARFYAIALSLAWLVPMPFVALVLLMGLALGYPASVPVAVSAVTIAASLGYLAARTFPTAARRFYGPAAPPRLQELYGARSFSGLLRANTWKGAGLRAKFAWQGIYCLPLPWFALGTLAFWPGVLTVGLWLLSRLAPAGLPAGVGPAVPGIFLLALLPGAAAVVRDFPRPRRAGTSDDSQTP